MTKHLVRFCLAITLACCLLAAGSSCGGAIIGIGCDDPYYYYDDYYDVLHNGDRRGEYIYYRGSWYYHGIGTPYSWWYYY